MRTSFFYGYIILALCFLNMLFMRGVSGSFSVFYVALLEEFRWSHGSGATIASINFLIYALASPFVGWLFDRLGPRSLMPTAALLIGIGLLLSGFSSSLWGFYLCFGFVTAIGQAGLGFVSNTALISHWFVRRRASAIGLATMGQGVGALLLVPLTQILISRWGWRSAFIALAGLVLFTAVPANALLQRRNPGEVGQLPDGDEASPTDGTRPDSTNLRRSRDWTLNKALGSFPFWCITTGHLALGTGLFLIFTHIAAHLVSQGFEKLLAAFIVGLIGFIRIGGTAVWGLLSDRLGHDIAYGISILITLVGIGCLVGIGASSPMWFVYTAAIVYGMGHSAGPPIYGAVIGDIFGGAKIGTILGFLEISFGLGSALGAWLGGYLFDLTGSYRWPFSLCLLAFMISYLGVHLSLVWHTRESQPAS